MNANHGGVFATSVRSDALLDEAHRAAADFVGADDPECCYFGANMTTLTFALSRALSKTWNPGDEIIVSRLDHDANFTPWVMAARDAGVTVNNTNVRRLGRSESARLHVSTRRLAQEVLSAYATGRRRLCVECRRHGQPVVEYQSPAHAVGAKVFFDAVHYAPHRRIDVKLLQCDFLVCSAYKFFGPHVGMMWGRREILESLPAYKVRPAPNDLPGKWMTGTQNHEGIAGTCWPRSITWPTWAAR
ncbi:MAG: aminotransferase class V-fold PLP-dependent enzyme [Pirellulales bacterium]